VGVDLPTRHHIPSDLGNFTVYLPRGEERNWRGRSAIKVTTHDAKYSRGSFKMGKGKASA